MYNVRKFIFGISIFVGVFVFSNQVYSANIFPGDEDYALVTDKPAAPVGGVDALMKKIYTDTSLKGKVHGKCYLLVYVGSNGSVDDVKVVKGLGGKESDAVDIVKEFKFTPGVNGSSPVKSKVALSLNFE